MEFKNKDSEMLKNGNNTINSSRLVFDNNQFQSTDDEVSAVLRIPPIERIRITVELICRVYQFKRVISSAKRKHNLIFDL
ncbi:hypothetical protein MASR2M44_17970 [Bacteroidota bacterium]